MFTTREEIMSGQLAGDDTWTPAQVVGLVVVSVLLTFIVMSAYTWGRSNPSTATSTTPAGQPAEPNLEPGQLSVVYDASGGDEVSVYDRPSHNGIALARLPNLTEVKMRCWEDAGNGKGGAIRWFLVEYFPKPGSASYELAFVKGESLAEQDGVNNCHAGPPPTR